MLACVVAAGLSHLVSRENTYTLKLVRQGVRIRRGKEVSALRSLTAADVMTRRVDVVPETATVARVIDHMQQTHHTGFPVVDGGGRLVGMVTLSDIRRTPLKGRLQRSVGAVMTRPAVAVSPGADLDQVLRLMSQRDIGRVPVTDPGDRVLGIVARSDVLRAHNARLIQLETGA